MKQKSTGLNKLLEHIKVRILYYIGALFIYIFPIIYIGQNINIVTQIETTTKTTVSMTWAIVGVLYLIFVAKFIRGKIHEMQPRPLKSFLNGISSLIPVSVLGAFINVVQEVINKIPEINIAQYIWNTILLIGVGLLLQILDAVFNRKYLYDLEITKNAKKQLDIEKKKIELEKAVQEMGE